MNQKITDIISQMSLEEKASLCSGASTFATQAIDRLSIPALHMADGPHGLRKQLGEADFMGKNESVTATCFPAACLMGAGFDRKQVRRMGEALGEACQANDVQVLLGPGINIKRSPLCGRNFEYFSEDPLVSGELGAAYIQGVQSNGVGACLKHFFANNQETRRRTQSSNLDERTIREIYTPAFETAIEKGKPWAVMTSYNKVNGKYVNEDSQYCIDLLKGEFGFDGLVVSDWAAVHDRVAVIRGGTELTMPADKANDKLLVDAVKNGTLKESELDAACADIIAIALRGTEARKETAEYNFEVAHNLACQIAAESMVLLKNEDKVLPLDPTKNIVVIGGFAAEPRYQGAGSSRVNPWKVPTMQEVTAAYPNVRYVKGFGMGDIMDADEQAEAVAEAQKADIAIVMAGLPPIMEGEGFDRWVMKLPRCQNALIEKVCAVQSNTVVVLENGGVVELPWADKPKVILEAYLGGEAVNEAIWDVLTGNVAPSGHLAETFPLRYEDNPSYLDWPGEGDNTAYSEGLFVGYRWYTTRNVPVRYPFGHGLTYTDFSYSDLCLSAERFQVDDTLTVSVTVKNIGDRVGKALVQLYVGAPLGTLPVRVPVQELRDFQKIELVPGESQKVEFILNKRSFAHWDETVHTWRVFGGTYTVSIGANAQEMLCSVPVQAEHEYIPDGKIYDIMTPISEVELHPAGRKFLSEIMPMVNAIIARMGMGKEQQAAMPYADQRPKETGLMAEPLQTLKRMLRNLPEEKWDTLFMELNRNA